MKVPHQKQRFYATTNDSQLIRQHLIIIQQQSTILHETQHTMDQQWSLFKCTRKIQTIHRANRWERRNFRTIFHLFMNWLPHIWPTIYGNKPRKCLQWKQIKRKIFEVVFEYFMQLFYGVLWVRSGNWLEKAIKIKILSIKNSDFK